MHPKKTEPQGSAFVLQARSSWISPVRWRKPKKRRRERRERGRGRDKRERERERGLIPDATTYAAVSVLVRKAASKGGMEFTALYLP